MALKNFELNPELAKYIKLYNYGVSHKKGKLNIKAMNSVSNYIVSDDYYEIEIISINDLIKQLNPDLLKMDCEGCEFEIIENCDLSMFNELIFKYHSLIVGKDHQNLINKLENEGFKTRIVSLGEMENVEEIGFIHAYK